MVVGTVGLHRIPGSTEAPSTQLEVASQGITATIDIQFYPSQRQVGASESGARMVEDTVDNDEIEPEMSISTIFHQLGAGEAEHTFTTMGSDDVALDMDTEIGYITEEESNDESDDDLDDSMYWNFGKFFLSLL